MGHCKLILKVVWLHKRTSLKPILAVSTLATCQLNRNLERTLLSIKKAKEAKATLCVDLEITGYGCLDRFLESDTLHPWEMIARISKDP
jgi:NAD+ synthase (glutamine-hydrolysing)